MPLEGSIAQCVRRLLPFMLLVFWGCAASGIFHTIHSGETLYRISQTYGVDELYLARINGISDPARIKTGDRIFIPGATQVKATLAPSIVTSSPPPADPRNKPTRAAKPTPSAKTGKSVPVATATKPAGAAAASKNTSVAKATPTGKGTPPSASSGIAPPDFTWPLRGELVRRFGAPGTPPSKGLEIAAPAGAQVAAAAAGKVIYSGDGIRSYGNLIIIRHDDAFFTVYGFNDRNLVTVGSFVSKGEKIALVGTPPAGGKTRLYFEIRRGKDAVNPTIYLP